LQYIQYGYLYNRKFSFYQKNNMRLSMFSKHYRCASVVSCLLLIVISFGSIFLPGYTKTAHAATVSGPTIAFNHKTVYIGQNLAVTGQGLTPQTSYQLVLVLNDGTYRDLGGYLWTDNNGNLSQTINFNPDAVVQGTYVIDLYPSGFSSTTPVVAQTTVHVVPSLTSVTGNPGLPVTIQGAGFSPNENLSIFFGDPTQGTPEGTTTSTEYGDVSFSFPLPAHLIPGTYSVTVVRSNNKPAAVSGKIHIYPLTLTAPGGSKAQQVITVRGTGFAPGEYVNLTWNANGGQQLYNDVADNKGAFRFVLPLPAAPLGSYIIQATGAISGLSVSTNINVGPGISLSNPNTYPGQSNPGGTIAVYGGGFNANEQVNVYFQNVKNGVTTVTSDSTGNITTTISVPLHYSPTTTYYVYAKNVAGTASAHAKFTFITPHVVFDHPFDLDINEGLIFVSGFGANESVQIVNHYQQPTQSTVTTLTTNAQGTVEASLEWPSTPEGKEIPFAVIGKTTKLVATSTYTVGPMFVADTDQVSYAIGNAGDMVSFSCKNFAANEQVNITFNKIVVATTTSGNDGSFKVAVTIPAIESVSTGSGKIQVLAVGTTSGLVAGSDPMFAITFYYQPTLTLTPTTGPSGTTITVTGAHFPANAVIPVGWDGPFTPDPNLWGYPQGTYALANADANGNFTQTIQADGLVSGQTYHVTAPITLDFSTTATFVAQ
jgi:hypothetical protein